MIDGGWGDGEGEEEDKREMAKKIGRRRKETGKTGKSSVRRGRSEMEEEEDRGWISEKRVIEAVVNGGRKDGIVEGEGEG